MNKELFDKIKEFCEYLTDWENKKQYYIEELLPNWTNHKMGGLTSEARQLFLDIYREINIDEWNNIINIIVNIKENYDKILEQAKRNQINRRKEKLIKLFESLSNKYGFQGFIHTTSFENFINIMNTNNIYSRNYIDKYRIAHKEIALKPVIDKTDDFYKNYVRFYWRTKTPTNYRNEGIKPKNELLIEDNSAHSPNPVVFLCNYSIAFDDNTGFTNENAGT